MREAAIVDLRNLKSKGLERNPNPHRDWNDSAE